MKKPSFFRQIKLFSFYKKKLKLIRRELLVNFNIKIDYADRMYTVLNINPDDIGEAFTLKKSDIDKISENYIKQYAFELSSFLDKKELTELYDYYKIEKVGKYSYLLVFGFSLFRSNKYYNFLYYGLMPLMIISIGILIFNIINFWL
jgi:hypothetical protein